MQLFLLLKPTARQLLSALAVCLTQSVIGVQCTRSVWLEAGYNQTSRQALAQWNMAQGELIKVLTVPWYWSPSPFTHLYSNVILKLSRIWHKISDINLHLHMYTHHRLDYCNLVIVRIPLKLGRKLLWLQKVAAPSLFRQVCMNQTCTLFGQPQIFCSTNALKVKR